MSRLRSQLQDTKIQPEVISQVHDEVIALCLRNYSSVPSIEIDGIICISLLDSKEQQVVKIHKTFKSVVADAPRKSTPARSNAYPNITSILSAGSPASFQDSPREYRSESEEPNFQKDINAISDLLKASDAAISADTIAKKDGAQESKRRKRKRNPPKHLSDIVYGRDNEKPDASEDTDKDLHKDNVVDNEKDVSQKSPSLVIVKEEPVDSGYEVFQASDGTSQSDTNNVDHNTAQKDHIDNVPESSKVCEAEGTVKIENIDQDNEYGITYNSYNDGEVVNDQTHDQTNDSTLGPKDFDDSENQSDDREWIYPETFDHEGLKLSRKTQNTGKEKHWLYGIAKDQRKDSASPEIRTNEITKMALLDKYYQQGSLAHKGYPREVQREERDPLGRSWIEMVKDNVTKYQAALMRTVNKNQKGQREEPAPGSASGLLKSLATPRSSLLNADHLKALLKEPPMNVEKAKLSFEKVRDTDQIASSSASERSRSTSVSPAPVVKIEIDEEPVEELMDTQNQTEDSENIQESEKPPSGKLESRYPALFNQLQQAKQPGQPNLDQSDSLVNRLPFISFQELFSQANPLPSTPRLSDSATRQLLEQAKINPYPSKANSKAKKSVWKWKKRYVKPKDNTGQVLSNTQVETDLAQTVADDTEFSEDRPLGIHMSAKKTFAHKKQKLDEGSDNEWTPSAAKDEVILSGDSQEDWGTRQKISTRLSTGDKPRMNFAELENSDIELDDEVILEEDNPEDQVELLPLHCRKNCGANFSSFTELKIHEDSCMHNSGAVGGAESVGTSEDFKCRFCGLDFNQEYRWHYHMVKVHRVNAEKTFLFR